MLVVVALIFSVTIYVYFGIMEDNLTIPVVTTFSLSLLFTMRRIIFTLQRVTAKLEERKLTPKQWIYPMLRGLVLLPFIISQLSDSF